MASWIFKAAVLAVTATLAAKGAMGQDVGARSPDPSTNYSPYLQHDYPDQVLFGDTHLHTAYSADAGLIGATTTPDDAYRFAKGETVTSSNGIEARLQRPLDFLVVADHAENLGLYIALDEGSSILESNDWAAGLRDIFAPRSKAAMDEAYIYWASAFALDPDGGDPLAGSALARTMWERMTEAAEQHNEPGAFTALIGYEWTSGPNGNNLHRNVIFRDGKPEADQFDPFSAYDSDDPEDLWDWMEQYEVETGGQVLAIPHNGNLSNGLMFDDVTLTDRRALDAGYAERRMRWEPIYEITQIKGDGEAHPFLSPDDAFADYETWDAGNLDLSEAKTKDMLQYEYAREALKNGLLLEKRLGTNPYKFGPVGSTDSHTALTAVEEENFFGKATNAEPSPRRMMHPFTETDNGVFEGYELVASGYAAVWAKENTREAIWDAMERKEIYGTTGPRIMVRFFGGWDYTAEDMNSRQPAFRGYEKGVPMGGDLRGSGKAPTFMVYALRDVIGANLDRIQIVKGWLDAKGETHEKVYDVAWSSEREPDANGVLPPVGNTVDIEAANWSNTIGASELGTVWTDPDFDPEESAFYYARVLEIPTPRWIVYDAFRFGIEIPDGAETTHQERAYTAPIWYTP